MAPREKKSAKAAALGLLAIRERSVVELTDKLREKDFPEEEITEAVDRMAELGYLDDERFARNLAEARTRLKRWGPKRVAADLKKRGIADGIIEEATRELRERESETIREAFESWLRKTGTETPLDKKTSSRAYRHLWGRGFRGSIILPLLKEHEKGEDFFG